MLNSQLTTYPRALLTLVIGLAPVAAGAQTLPAPASEASHWGVSVSFAPTWKIPSTITSKFTDDTVSVQGTYFTIGVVHGRSLGGDWGVSFVHEPVSNTSTGHNNKQDCFSNGCFDTSTSAIAQNVKMTGALIHVYLPFGTIKERVQIGITVAGGVGKISGNLVETENNVTTTFHPRTGLVTATPAPPTVSTVALTDELGLKTVPLGNIAAVVAVIVRPDLKIRWEGGIILPGTSVFRIMATYLIGAK